MHSSEEISFCTHGDVLYESPSGLLLGVGSVCTVHGIEFLSLRSTQILCGLYVSESIQSGQLLVG